MGIFDTSLISPDFWEVWRRCITKPRLFEIRPFAGWLGIPNALHRPDIITPIDLESLSFSECTVLEAVNASGGYHLTGEIGPMLEG